jgi:hypothetical protein
MAIGLPIDPLVVYPFPHENGFLAIFVEARLGAKRDEPHFVPKDQRGGIRLPHFQGDLFLAIFFNPLDCVI